MDTDSEREKSGRERESLYDTMKSTDIRESRITIYLKKKKANEIRSICCYQLQLHKYYSFNSAKSVLFSLFSLISSSSSWSTSICLPSEGEKEKESEKGGENSERIVDPFWDSIGYMSKEREYQK